MVWHKVGESALFPLVTELLSGAQRIGSWGASRSIQLHWMYIRFYIPGNDRDNVFSSGLKKG